jgi:outer membrane lipoprotein-sorting protein
MKRIVGAMMVVMVFAGAVQAQNTKQLVKMFTDKINGHKSIEMAFTLTFDNPLKGISRNFAGTLLCSGDKYRLLTDDEAVYSDGRNKWLCNKETNEVYIMYVSDDEKSADITDHPLRFLTSYQKDFTCKEKEKRTENGKALTEIEFLPTSKQAAYTAILLTLETETANPHIIKYLSKSGDYTIRITSITPDVEVFDGYFAFPKHKYPGIEIIDLR